MITRSPRVAGDAIERERSRLPERSFHRAHHERGVRTSASGLAPSDDERRDVLLTTARRLGTAVQNVEKDFWVWPTCVAPLLRCVPPTPVTARRNGSSRPGARRRLRAARADVLQQPGLRSRPPVPGTLTLAPSSGMLEPLERDYDAMAGMIMETVSRFAEVMDAVSALERRLNEKRVTALAAANGLLNGFPPLDGRRCL